MENKEKLLFQKRLGSPRSLGTSSLGTRTLGIWGFGLTGKSLLRFFSKNYPQCTLAICARTISSEDRKLIESTANVRVIAESQLHEFFEFCDLIVPSPGIDLRPYLGQYGDKLISEIDVFSAHWTGHVIALTGSLGKTSTVHIIQQMLTRYGYAAHLAGNVGFPLLDLVAAHNAPDQWAVLELSSFQLDQCKVPLNLDAGIITCIVPNHLDRHNSLGEYRAAKYKLFNDIMPHATAIIPLEQKQNLSDTPLATHEKIIFCTTNADAANAGGGTICSYNQRSREITHLDHTTQRILGNLPASACSYPENWLIVYALLDALGIDTCTITDHTVALPHHRVALIRTINGVDWYNDSKSTVMDATLAAINKLAPCYTKIILLLGGTSKGVDRTAQIALLANYNVHVICFGKEHEFLATACMHAQIKNTPCATLDHAAAIAQEIAAPGDAVLLSPGGASFDLFANYEARGSAFIEMVKDIMAQDT